MNAIIFDAYGTIINTKNGSIQAVESILNKNKSTLDPVKFYSRWKQLHREYIQGLKVFIKEEEIFKQDLKALYQEYQIDSDYESDVKIMLNTLGIREVYPDTKKIIALLREKYKVYIGSNSDELPLTTDIINNGIEVDGHYSSEKLQIYKPNKEFFIRLLNEINISNSDAIYIGDSKYDDIYGAKNAGIKAIWVNRKFEKLEFEEYMPDYEISELDELKKIL